MLQCGTVGYCWIRYVAMWNNGLLLDTLCYNVEQWATAGYVMLQCGTVDYCWIRYVTMWNSGLLLDTLCCNVEQWTTAKYVMLHEQGSHQENVKIPESGLMPVNKIGTQHFHSKNNGDPLIT